VTPFLEFNPERIQLVLLLAAPLLLAVAAWRGWFKPGSLGDASRTPTRSAGLHATTTWFLAAGALFVLQIFGAAALLGLLGMDDRAAGGQAGFARQALTTLAVYALVTPAALGVMWFLARGPTLGGSGKSGGKDLRLALADVPRGLLWFLALLPVLTAVSWLSLKVAGLITGSKPDPVAHQTLAQLTEHRDNPWMWALVAAVVIGAPIFEEVFYRGLLQTAMVRATGSPWLAVLSVSAGFAIMHNGVAQPHALPVLFALSLAMGVLYERTASLTVPVMMHIAFNAYNIAMALYVVG
jgi:membrane protease YdiL (CAAX protease family)